MHGMQDHISFMLCDYRQIPTHSKYDRIISWWVLLLRCIALLIDFFCWVTTAAISNIPAWFGLISWYIWLRCITRELMHACKFADVSSARWSRALGTNTWMISSAAASPFWLKTAYSSCRYEINELSNLYTSLWSQLHDLRLTCTDQFISIPEERYEEYRRSSDFIKEYIFPGGCLPSLARITSAMSAASRLWYASSSLVI